MSVDYNTNTPTQKALAGIQTALEALTGTVGPKGETGAQGAQGATGPQGPAGIAAGAADPETGETGQVFLNTTSHKLKIYADGAWSSIYDLSSLAESTSDPVPAG